jgi:hypothetical protein
MSTGVCLSRDAAARTVDHVGSAGEHGGLLLVTGHGPVDAELLCREVRCTPAWLTGAFSKNLEDVPGVLGAAQHRRDRKRHDSLA